MPTVPLRFFDTDLGGVSLSPTPFIRQYPASTNYADGDNDLSSGTETVDLTTSGTGDYTLSVYGTAAVTIAAGTAIGTGFGQATEGSIITFNLSIAGTVTLTLNSGALDTYESAAMKQVEKQFFSTAFIVTSGASSTRNACLTRYPYSSSIFNQNEGVLTFDWISDLDYGDVLGSNGLFSVQDFFTSVLYDHLGSGVIITNDGTNLSEYAVNWIKNNKYRFVVRWSTKLNELQLGYKDIDGAGNWIWDLTPGNYDGSFISGNWVGLFVDNNYNNRCCDLKIYNKDKEVSWIEENF